MDCMPNIEQEFPKSVKENDSTNKVLFLTLSLLIYIQLTPVTPRSVE